MVVHTNSHRKGEPYNATIHSSRQYPMRFFVTRHPFTRIISSYLDKFYLPDFWFLRGKKYAEKTLAWVKSRPADFLTQHFDDVQSLFAENSQKQLKCGKRITFAQFVKATLNDTETHWAPIHSLCNPCTFEPTHIVHTESFLPDSRVILRQMGIENVVDDLNHDTTVSICTLYDCFTI